MSRHGEVLQATDLSQRNAIGDVLREGDKVRIAVDFHDNCECCDYAVGIDYDMHDYENSWWWVDRVCEREGWRDVRCGARVFEIDEWFFTTCWIDGYQQKKPPTPAWEI